MSVPCHQGARVGRVQYRKAEGHSLKFVIYERDLDARESFAEQEVGELRWYAFTPSESEKRFARELLAIGRGAADWGELLHLDAAVARRLRPALRPRPFAWKEPQPC